MESGIVRRIDELGRIVIPKEMRKTLRIKEGEPLEIYADKDCLVFKKYSPVGNLRNFSEAVADGIEDLTGKQCVITDNDFVIYLSHKRRRDLIGKSISKDIDKILKDKETVCFSNSDGKTVPIVEGENFCENQIIVPIISNGDCFGAIMVYDRDKNSKFSTLDLKFAEFGASFLGKQCE